MESVGPFLQNTKNLKFLADILPNSIQSSTMIHLNMRSCLLIFKDLTTPIVLANGGIELPLKIYGEDSGYISSKQIPSVTVCLQTFAASGYKPSFYMIAL